MPRSKADIVAETETAVEIIDNQDKQLAPYLDGKPYNQERLIGEVELYYAQHSNSAFELGKRLMILKATVERGNFISQVLERVGITRSYAAQLMSFARTIVEIEAAGKGAIDMEKLKSMDQQKVRLLGEIAEDDPDEIEATGKINGRSLDEWDAMNRKQLRETIRKQNDIIAQGMEQLQSAKDKILKERERVEDLLSATPNAVTQSVTRLGGTLRDALASFDATAHCEDELTPDAPAILDLVGVKAQLRTFYDRINDIIDDRFPAVNEAEIPTEFDPQQDANIKDIG